MANKFCTSCGAALDETKKFCTECGQPTAVDAPIQEPVMAGSAPAPQPAAAPPPPQQPYVPPQQQPYAAPAQAVYAPPPPAPDTPPTGKYAPIGLGGWLGIMLLMLIPIVNIILIIVWACGGCKRVTQRSFARASLIFMVVAIVLSMTIGFVAKKAIDTIIHESGIAQQFGLPEGIGIGDLWGALTTGDVSDLAAGVVAPGGKGALDEMFPDGVFDEQVMIDQGYTDEEIAVIRAVMENDRQALLDMGYSQQEIEAVFKAFR